VVVVWWSQYFSTPRCCCDGARLTSLLLTLLLQAAAAARIQAMRRGAVARGQVQDMRAEAAAAAVCVCVCVCGARAGKAAVPRGPVFRFLRRGCSRRAPAHTAAAGMQDAAAARAQAEALDALKREELRLEREMEKAAAAVGEGAPHAAARRSSSVCG
jgi:hypothetical protein